MSRPDISDAVREEVAREVHGPTDGHWGAGLKILKFLKFVGSISAGCDVELPPFHLTGTGLLHVNQTGTGPHGCGARSAERHRSCVWVIARRVAFWATTHIDPPSQGCAEEGGGRVCRAPPCGYRLPPSPPPPNIHGGMFAVVLCEAQRTVAVEFLSAGGGGRGGFRWAPAAAGTPPRVLASPWIPRTRGLIPRPLFAASASDTSER